jgi:hypothetical protein
MLDDENSQLTYENTYAINAGLEITALDSFLFSTEPEYYQHI